MFPKTSTWKSKLISSSLPPQAKILAFFFVGLGISFVLSALFPILSYSVIQITTPKLIDPTDVTRVTGPKIVNILGVTTVDYSRPANWFTNSAPASEVDSKVTYFTLSIPRLDLKDVPIEVNGDDLKKNAIHYPGTALPGEYGNSVIFGHSALPQLYKKGSPLTIFNPLIKAKVGDEIIIKYDGVTYTYKIKETKEVRPTQIEVLAQHFDRHELTLITCIPLGTYWHRFVAVAELVN